VRESGIRLGDRLGYKEAMEMPRAASCAPEYVQHGMQPYEGEWAQA
jgi:hypothetical protein